jgi:RNA polymerase sigma-70 factor (ECF subfamily)
MDTQLVVRAQAGDQDAFTRLATESASRLHRVAYNILRDRGLAEDATQQALLSMRQALPTLRDPSRFDAWAYRTVIHACYAESRRTRRFLAAMKQLASDGRDTSDAMRRVEDRDELDGALARLSLDHRTVLVLRFHLDLKIDDIASVLDIPVGTARSRLDRAMKKIRPALASGTPVERQSLPGEVQR